MKQQKKLTDLPIPVSKTALMQHLQTLVLRGNPYWIGGSIPMKKLERFLEKMGRRYPLTRDERGRTYDRSRGRATTHLIVYPVGGEVLWWILSSDGTGGLMEESGEDFRVAKNAMAAGGHIQFDDYALLYAHKKDARTLVDAKSGKEKKVIKDMSTWTWKMNQSAFQEVKATIEHEARSLNLGDDNLDGNLYGLKGALAFQRRRPLFSGVRAQVLQLHRLADDLWAPMRNTWLERHPGSVEAQGAMAGRLRPLREVVSHFLPKMGRFRVFSGQAIATIIEK